MTCIDAPRCIDKAFNGNVAISTLTIEMSGYGRGVLHTDVKKDLANKALVNDALVENYTY